MKVSPLDVVIPKHLMRSALDEEKFRELIESMEVNGMFHPILVREVEGAMELIMGYRRLTAAKKLRWRKIEATQVKATDAEAERMKVAENTIREDVSPMDEGKYISGMMQTLKLNQAQVAAVIGKSEAYVSQRLATVNWPGELSVAVHKGDLSFSTARILMTIKDPESRVLAVGQAIEFGVTLRVAQAWAERYNLDYENRQKRLAQGPVGEVPQAEFRNVLKCQACGEEHHPDEIIPIHVDVICKELIAVPQWQSMMANAKHAALAQTDPGKPETQATKGPPPENGGLQ